MLVRVTDLRQEERAPHGWYIVRTWLLPGDKQSGLGCYFEIPGEAGMTEGQALEAAAGLDDKADERLLGVWKMETRQ